MANYLDELAKTLDSYPVSIGAVSSDKLNPSMFNKLQQMRLLQEVQKRYLAKGNLSPIERFGQGTASAMAQSPQDF